MRRISLAVFLLAFVTGSAAADSAPNRNLVSLTASAKADVASDLLIVLLFIEHDGRDQAKAANQVNVDMAAALASAKQTKGVTAQTLDYRSDPIYNEQQKISAWRVHQGLRLESADHDGLSALLGKLQAQLAIESVGYGVSDGLRATVEERLTDDAIKRFAARAQQVATSFGRKTYTLVNVTIEQRGNTPPPMAYSGRAMAMKAEGASPALEAGTQSLEVAVSGTIELAP